MIIPVDSLSSEVLHNIVESFVLREGTDYGDIEFTLAQKVEQVIEQLRLKQVFIQYSEEHETVTILPKDSILLSEFD